MGVYSMVKIVITTIAIVFLLVSWVYADQNIYDNKNNYKVRVDNKGQVYDKKDNYIYKIDNRGQVYDKQGQYKGRIEINKKGTRWRN